MPAATDPSPPPHTQAQSQVVGDGFMVKLHPGPLKAHGAWGAPTSHGWWLDMDTAMHMGSLGHTLQIDRPRDWANLALYLAGGGQQGVVMVSQC